jgi:cell division septation protein DedD
VPKNEDGEFELILGNRQLLTVFFIVVVLFGIFFAMGYILGRPAGPATEVAATKKAERPLIVETPGQNAPALPVAKPATEVIPVEKPKPAETAKAEPEKPAPAKAETPKPEPKKPEPAKSKPEPAKRPEPAKAAAASSNEPSGTYLQLAATSQREANLEVERLRKKGFKAIAVEKPDDPNLFRVLVGPVADGSTNKTKADLKAAGFPGDKAIKRTF